MKIIYLTDNQMRELTLYIVDCHRKPPLLGAAEHHGLEEEMPQWYYVHEVCNTAIRHAGAPSFTGHPYAPYTDPTATGGTFFDSEEKYWCWGGVSAFFTQVAQVLMRREPSVGLHAKSHGMLVNYDSGLHMMAMSHSEWHACAPFVLLST